MTGIGALLNPASIAIVGATPRADSLGGRPALNLAYQGYKGRLYPINPRYEMIGDAKCYPAIAALPEAPDVVLVLVGADRVFDTLDQAAAIGAKAAIVFGGGFAELGGDGAGRQHRLQHYRLQGLRICGPNCNGVFNVRGGIAMGFSPSFEAPARVGRVAMISQSGAIATGMSSRGMEMGIGFSHVIATGNEADLEIADFIEYLVDDPEIAAFACFIESLKDPSRFLRVAETALRLGKPIVALKAGRSEIGQRAAQSHTGAITGSYEVLAGALRQKGVIVAENLDELLGLSAVFATEAKPAGGGVAVASLSGGMAALIADQCDRMEVPLASFAPATAARLRQVMPAIATVANPLDVTGQVVADPHLWTNCMAAVSADPGVDATISILSILAGNSDRRLAEDVRDTGAGVLRVCVWASAAPPGCGIDTLRSAGIPTFLRSDDAVSAVAAWRRYWTSREDRLAGLQHPRQINIQAPHGASAWALLEAAGLPVARHALVAEPAALPASLAGMRFPLALKIQSDDIPHKTELNLLRLGVRTAADAAVAFAELMAAAQRHRPDAAIDGVLVQEMFAGRRELILGVRHEALLGPAIVFGLGGIFSEVMRDVSVRIAPLSGFDVQEMIGALRSRALFGAVRGLGAISPQMLTDILLRFSDLVLARAGSIAEFEINPLIVADDGTSCVAVDVLIGSHSEV